MKKISKIISFGLLPALTLILFLIIGIVQGSRENGGGRAMHHAMSSRMFANIWLGRGIYSMLVVIGISFIFFSEITITRKVIISLLFVLLNAPVIYFIIVLISLPIFILVVPIINLLAFIPFYIKFKSSPSQK